MRFTFVFVALLSVAAFTTIVRAGPPAATQRATNENVETRVYDVNDLVRPRINYPLGTGGANAGGMPGGAPGQLVFGAGGAVAPAEPVGLNQQQVVDSLIKLIEDTIDQESWKDNGGPTGSLRELNGQLIVTQTTQNHARIEKLLKEMRTQQGPAQMVCVRAYWLILNPKDIAAIFATNMNKKASVGKEMPWVEDSVVVGDKLYCQGQTICFNGQTVHITSGRQWSVVSKLNPVVGSNAVGYDPTMSVANSGVSLQVTPQMVPQSESAILDLRSTVTETRGPTGPIDLAKAPATQPVVQTDLVNATSTMIDRLNVVNQEFATTVRLPLGQKILLGGMTLEPASQTDPGRQLYLVVQMDAVK